MLSPFEPGRVGRYPTRNRVVMAPMTRSRAYGTSLNEMMATYYAQRAEAGLIVAEGTQPSVVGQGYPDTPGIHSAEHVVGWHPITDAVHERDGLIFLQLMHVGRVGDPGLYRDGMMPVGASPVRAAGQIYTHEGPKDMVVPAPLDAAGIKETIDDFATAACNAVEAGFDGIELHGANGYLLHQFMSSNANLRDDEWGGTVEGRIRFTAEVTRAVSEAIGADRVGLKISPAVTYGDVIEQDHHLTYPALIDALNPLGLAYLHLGEGPDNDLTPQLRKQWQGTFILNPFTGEDYTRPEHLELIESGAADMVSFGSLFLANPDLLTRLRDGSPLNQPDRETYFGGDHRGYIDYPALDGEPDADSSAA